VLQPSSEYTVRDQQRMTRAVNYFAWQARLALAPLGRRIVEVGCGIGNFTRMMLDRDLVIGLDIDPNCIAQHRERFADRPQVQSHVLDALDPAFGALREHQPDSIVCLNVLEHISDDLATLRAFHSILPPGGRVVLLVPAFEALYGPIDKHLGHYRRYTKASLRKTAQDAGFQARELRHMNTIGFFGWWVNAKLIPREEQSEGQIELFDKFIVPVQEKIESWIAPPFGQSVFAVLEKSA
jgi:2-polyprenyl-3-methyl-5-hydroxy-6-metoxy-1,4-benzoquinol methylase